MIIKTGQMFFNLAYTDYRWRIKDKTSKPTNYRRSLLATGAYGLTVAMVTIKEGLAELDGNSLRDGSVFLWPVVPGVY